MFPPGLSAPTPAELQVLLHCPHCGGTLKIIAAIEDPPVIAKTLTHLGLCPGTAPLTSAAIRSIPNGLI